MKINIYQLIILILIGFILGFMAGNIIGLSQRVEELNREIKSIKKEVVYEKRNYQMFSL